MQKLPALALTLLLFASSARAVNFNIPPPSGNWNKVQRLLPGANLAIELQHKQEIIGEFIRLDENALVIKELEKERTFPKDSVARIKLIRPESRARNAAIWGGILFAAGFATGYASAAYAADQNTMSSGARAQTGAGVGALAGGIGAAIALARHPGTRGEVIYQAR